MMDGQGALTPPVAFYTCCSSLKRESIVRIVVLQEGQQQQQQQQQAQDNVSLVMVSAKGRVAVYNQIQEALPLKLTSSFTLRLSAAPVAGLKGQSHQQQSLSSPSTTTAAAAAGRRGRSTPGSATSSRTYNNSQPVQKMHLSRGWITDCVHMSSFGVLVVASSERCLHFFTTRVTPYIERFRLDGMKDIPTSLAYLTPGSGANKTEPLLAVGDDNGDVFILRFLKPTQSLFKKREVDDIQQIYWRELHLQAGMVSLTILPGTHKSPVLQIDIKRALHRVISCSKSSHVSLSIRHITRKQSATAAAAMSPITIRSAPGIMCFDYDDQHGLIATGSSDSKIRLWSPTHQAKCWMVLRGHSSAIAAVLIHEKNFLWSICDQSELRYWELNQGQTLWKINLNFPFTQNKTRVQYSQRPLLIVGTSLYISCGDAVATVQLPTAKNEPPNHHHHHHHPNEELLKVDIARGTRRASKGSTNADSSTLLDVSAESELEPHQQAAESKIPFRFREGLLDYGYREEDDVFKGFLTDLQKVFSTSDVVTERLKDVEEQVLTLLSSSSSPSKVEPVLLQQTVYDWEAEEFGKPPPPTNLIPINQIKLKELNEMESMKKNVKQGTPTCGLKLIEPESIDLPKGLPVTSRMKKHGINSFSSLNEVRSANFDLFTDRMTSLSSERTSLASSVMSYYKKKKLSDKFGKPTNESESQSHSQQLMVLNRSQQSSRKSSLVSDAESSRSSAAGDEGNFSIAIPNIK